MEVLSAATHSVAIGRFCCKAIGGFANSASVAFMRFRDLPNTGKQWYRRNFTKALRRIARAAGLPDELQIVTCVGRVSRGDSC
jgi:hypothetical protein